MVFATEPGVSAKAPTHWPNPSGLRLASGQLTLVQFLHPKCSCSRASMEQLAKLQREFPGRLAIILVVWQPASGDPSWKRLPMQLDDPLRGVRVMWDRGGQLASVFDAHTSGQTYVYEPDGTLRFAGGVTSTRGNSWGGPALTTLAEVISGSRSNTKVPVFCCSL